MMQRINAVTSEILIAQRKQNCHSSVNKTGVIMHQAINKAFFDNAIAWHEFQLTMERNTDIMSKAYDLALVSKADRDWLGTLTTDLRVLVFGEDISLDAAMVMPIIASFADSSTAIEARFARASEYDGVLMSYYAVGGRVRLPIVIVFDDKFNEMTHWTETSGAVYEARATARSNSSSEVEYLDIVERSCKECEPVSSVVADLLAALRKAVAILATESDTKFHPAHSPTSAPSEPKPATTRRKKKQVVVDRPASALKDKDKDDSPQRRYSGFYDGPPDDIVDLEVARAGELPDNERAVLTIIREEGDLIYRRLSEIAADEIEGMRLACKNLKAKGLIRFDGIFPGFETTITFGK